MSLLRRKISEKVTLTDEEFKYCESLFTAKRIRRKHAFLQEGEICKYTAFVEKGLLRSYTIDEKGTEHILQFAMEGGWMADLYSFLTNEPSNLNIEALEETDVLLINHESWETLHETIPKYERFTRILLQNNLIATQRRLLNSLSMTAEEKYIQFLELYPDCAQRVPQHMIASYLGITRETLSRVRKQIIPHK